MAAHPVALYEISEAQQRRRIAKELEREGRRFANAAARRVLRLLRGREHPLDKDASLELYVEGLLRQEGVQQQFIRDMAQKVLAGYSNEDNEQNG